MICFLSQRELQNRPESLVVDRINSAVPLCSHSEICYRRFNLQWWGAAVHFERLYVGALSASKEDHQCHPSLEISGFMLLFKNKMSKEQSGCRDSCGNWTVLLYFPHIISLLRKPRDWEMFIA